MGRVLSIGTKLSKEITTTEYCAFLLYQGVQRKRNQSNHVIIKRVYNCANKHVIRNASDKTAQKESTIVDHNRPSSERHAYLPCCSSGTVRMDASIAETQPCTLLAIVACCNNTCDYLACTPASVGCAKRAAQWHAMRRGRCLTVV